METKVDFLEITKADFDILCKSELRSDVFELDIKNTLKSINILSSDICEVLEDMQKPIKPKLSRSIEMIYERVFCIQTHVSMIERIFKNEDFAAIIDILYYYETEIRRAE